MSHAFMVRDTEAGRSLVKKLHEQGKPGALILVTDDEMAELKHLHILPLPEVKSDGEGVKA